MKSLAAIETPSVTTLTTPRPSPAVAHTASDARAPGQSGVIRIELRAGLHLVRTSDSSFRW
jgi:hypothetical protein